jgi:hypothetical protein
MEGIFEIIWIVLIVYFLYRTFFAGARKTQQQQREEQPPSQYTETGSQKTRTRDEILDELRNIFGEPQKPSPSPRQPRTQPENISSPPVQDKYSSFSGTDFIDTTVSDVTDQWNGPQLESPGLTQTAHDGKSFDFLFNIDDIRQGIIISEVLGSPKSRRS